MVVDMDSLFQSQCSPPVATTSRTAPSRPRASTRAEHVVGIVAPLAHLRVRCVIRTDSEHARIPWDAHQANQSIARKLVGECRWWGTTRADIRKLRAGSFADLDHIGSLLAIDLWENVYRILVEVTLDHVLQVLHNKFVIEEHIGSLLKQCVCDFGPPLRQIHAAQKKQNRCGPACPISYRTQETNTPSVCTSFNQSQLPQCAEVNVLRFRVPAVVLGWIKSERGPYASGLFSKSFAARLSIKDIDCKAASYDALLTLDHRLKD